MLEFVLKPWRLMVLLLASQINHEQQRAIEYLYVENQVLREKLGNGKPFALRTIHQIRSQYTHCGPEDNGEERL